MSTKRTFPFRLIAFLAAALAHGSAAQAQTSTLTLEQVLADIENVNLDVLTSRENVTQTQEGANIVRSGLLPQVGVGASQFRTDRASSDTNDSFAASVRGSMAVIDLRVRDNLKAARAGVEVSQLIYQTSIQSVLAAVASVYFEHQRNIAFGKVIDANIERAQVLLDLARNRLEAGVATQIDVTRAEAELVTAQQAKLQQEVVVAQTDLQIKQILNMDLGTAIELDDFRVRRDVDPTLATYPLDGVLEGRPDYRAAVARLEQIRLERRAATRERVPTVDVVAEGGVTSETPADGNEEGFWTAGVQLNVPIFEGDRISANVRQADSRLRQADFDLLNLRNQIDSEFRIAMRDVTSQLAQIAVAEKNLELAGDELRLARVRYEQGVADNRELIDAENRYANAGFNLVGALYRYHVARVELARVRGDVRMLLAERAPVAPAPAPAPAAGGGGPAAPAL